MKPFSTVEGRPVPLPVDNVDTDQIIPASFLKVVDRQGLARGLFHGWRFRGDGSPDPEFVLHQAQHEGARILLVGDNFGCGSSREHAPWALQAWGFEVILGRGFADIFKGNAHRNGLLTVSLSPPRHEALVEQVREDPMATVSIDLGARLVSFPDETTEAFQIDAFARNCMLKGIDPLGHLLDQLPAIREHEAQQPARVHAQASSEPGETI